MADIAKLLIEGVQRIGPPGIAEAYNNAQQLALRKQQLQLQKAQAEQRKLQIEVTKDTKIMDTVKLLDKTQDPSMKKMLGNVLMNKVKMYGRQEMFNDDYVKNLINSNEMRAKLIGLEMSLTEQVQNGQMSQAEAHQQYQMAVGDPELLAQMNTERIYEASKFFESERGKDRRAAMMAQFREEAATTEFQRAAPKEVARNTAKDWVKFRNAGGLASGLAKLKKVKEARDAFKSGNIKTGGIGGALKSATQTGAAILDPEFKSASDKLRSSINLKASLDSQFSAAEAKQQYDMRTVDGALPTEENADRAEAIFQESKNDFINRVEAFRQAGYPVGNLEKQYEQEMGEPYPSSAPQDQGAGTAPPPQKVQKYRSKLKTKAGKEQVKNLIMSDPTQLSVFARAFGMDEETLRMILGLEQ